MWCRSSSRWCTSADLSPCSRHCLLAGGTVTLYEGFDVERYVAGLLEHRPTLICTHIDVLAQVVRLPGARLDWFSSLRGVYVAFIVTRPGKIVSAEELTDFLAEHIAAYKIPARIHFQHHLPLTASGKIAHQELQEPT